jgi:5-methylcytosine-specific restriction endonuclease McrA
MVTQRDGACVRCGSTFRLSAHHVIPRAEGGADQPSNSFRCVTCHRAETAREHTEQRR